VEKLARAKALGLDEGDAIATADGRFAEAVLARTAGRGADLVLELVGGAYVAEDLGCVAPRGRIVVVGLMAGASAEVNLARLLHRRVELRGTVLRARPLEEKILAAQALERHLVPLLERGALRSVVDRVLPLERASEAHAILQSNETFGKLVLTVS
jgi:NADPH:quinone reductase-like Zn-dependent oxidoreductase